MHVMGTAGHVDHGKSRLVERLTGIDPDRFEEEKRRGLTIDLGFAWLTLPSDREVGIVDVPGHERFIKNMLAGAGAVSLCLFVVSANEGWMPQSAEHLSALTVLGISGGVVALTKVDLVDEEMIEVATDEIRDKLVGSPLQDAEIVACSAVTGAGLEELKTEIDRLVRLTPPPPDEGRPRLWVDRVFTIAGAGTVVTGTLGGGSFAAGDSVEISPEKRSARIRSIQSHKKEVERIGPGNRVALNLAGLARQGASRGDAIVRNSQWEPTSRTDVEVSVLPRDMTGVDHRLTAKGAHLLYVGSAETPVRISLIGSTEIGAGHKGFARLFLRDPLPLKRGDRFVLRDAGRVVTFGGGRVLDPRPGPERIRPARRLELLSRLSSSDGAGALTAIVEFEDQVLRSEALMRSGTAEAEGVDVLGDRFFSRPLVEQLMKTLREQLRDWHRRNPLDQGMPREASRRAVELEPDAFEDLLAMLDDVEATQTVVRLASFSVELSPDQQRARADLIGRLEQSAFVPPPSGELNADPALLRSLVASGELVRIGDFYLTKNKAVEARSTVRRAIEETGPLTVAQIRDLLGTTRKYAVPLCEWLDATGATLRKGDLRALGPNP
ncbi:MAG: selenocysteine-specific translation elongation factor [Actinomycetota bacterium]|nr:selenocysteine-specific translation elongation factor [Actinomycetota bacterium]